MQKLLFSDKEEPLKAVNVASVPQRSPFRYPVVRPGLFPDSENGFAVRRNAPDSWLSLLLEGVLSL